MLSSTLDGVSAESAGISRDPFPSLAWSISPACVARTTFACDSASSGGRASHGNSTHVILDIHPNDTAVRRVQLDIASGGGGSIWGLPSVYPRTCITTMTGQGVILGVTGY